MAPERWRRIEEIVQSALDSPLGDRSAFLDAACAGDAELRGEVESLLGLHKDGTYTASSGFADAMRVLEELNARAAKGRIIGAYKVLREIGRGGMGTVFL